MPGFVATIAAPAGIITAITKEAERRGMDQATLLARAGVTQAQFDDLQAALAAADGEVFRRLFNATYSYVAVSQQTTAIREGADGKASPNSFNAPISSAFGDLSE